MANINWQHNNLAHVIVDQCTDPDCELHHIDVAIAEEVIDETNLAFWIAGFHAGAQLVQTMADEVPDRVRDAMMEIRHEAEGN